MDDQWATVELMGHAQTAGRIVFENGLLRVDVPIGDTYHTEYYGMAAIYRVSVVSEEIARAYATRRPDIVAYDAPIITREQHNAAMSQAQEEITRLRNKLYALPAPEELGENCLGEDSLGKHSYNGDGSDVPF